MSDNQDALLALADRIDEANERPIVIHKGAATELRRLHSELERKSDAIQRLWKERDELRSECRTLVRQNGEWQELNTELVEALRWYVDTDEVMEMEGNEFWLDGRERARAALAKVEASK